MADVRENVAAQLFVKELPPTGRAYFDGARQDFRSKHLTTNVDNVESDTAIENAFQKQLNLTEYYKSPYVFDTVKRDYMSKTMDAEYETEKVSLEPEPLTDRTGSQPIDLKVGTRESFGAYTPSANNNRLNAILAAVLVVLFLYFINIKK
jgi:hypothetical protein